jgi:hypothetical protein
VSKLGEELSEFVADLGWDHFRFADNPDGIRIWLPRTSYLESFRPTERLQDADELAKWRTAPGNR